MEASFWLVIVSCRILSGEYFLGRNLWQFHIGIYEHALRRKINYGFWKNEAIMTTDESYNQIEAL